MKGEGGGLALETLLKLICDAGRLLPITEAALDGGAMGLSLAKNPDCLRFAGEGDGGIKDRLSIALSDNVGSERC